MAEEREQICFYMASEVLTSVAKQIEKNKYEEYGCEVFLSPILLILFKIPI
jgi:hypothetical protein